MYALAVEPHVGLHIIRLTPKIHAANHDFVPFISIKKVSTLGIDAYKRVKIVLPDHTITFTIQRTLNTNCKTT